jgi:N-acetylglucosamine-6-phosphate deacetylase
LRLGVEAALVDGRLLAGDVSVEDGVVTAVGLSLRAGARGIAAPGFVDLQVNGFAGVDFMAAGASDWARAGDALLASGVTALAPTFVTAPEDELTEALRGMPAGGIGPRVLGAHLEGPFLSPRRLGAHAAGACRPPDLALLRRLLAAGPVSQVTLAPELPSALELVDELVARGIVVSAGHTDASAEEAHRAFDRGVRTVTHLFNAMRPPAHRDPGIAYAALARPDVVVQLIVDRVHLSGDTVLTAWNAAHGRAALVTDAVAAAGAGDGTYALGGRALVAAGGVVRGEDGRLAGSALTMIEAVRNLHGLGVELAAALAAASAVPARVARRPDLGRLAVGAPADVVVVDDRLEVLRVLTAPATPAR